MRSSTRDDGPRVLLRADGARETGRGHMMRMLALANRLSDSGAQTTFATATQDATVTERLQQAGHRVIHLLPTRPATPGVWPREVQLADADQVRRQAPGPHDVVVVDHYGIDATWETRMRSVARTIVVVDDLADRHRDCDLLVDQNWYGRGTAQRYENLIPKSARRLLGPRYALLQSDYARLHRTPRAPPRWPPQRVLVSFGGTDAAGETEKVMRVLVERTFRRLVVDVVLGSAEAATSSLRQLTEDHPNATLHIAVPTLAPLLHRADVAVGASGAATWERICLRVPAIVATTRSSQSGVTAQFDAAGLTTWVGLAAETTADRYRQALTSSRMPPIPPPIADGLGADRIAAALHLQDEEICVRPATEGDVSLFLGVDHSGLDGWPSSLEGPHVWAREEERFRIDLAEQDDRLLVLMAGTLPIGRARVAQIAERIRLAFVLDGFVGTDMVERTAEVLGADAWDHVGGRFVRNRGGRTGTTVPHTLTPFGATIEYVPASNSRP